jgi:multiple antibiotic resistance protein
MNPIANTPIFIALTDGMDGKEKRTVAVKSTVTAFIIVSAFVILGKYIFELFGITIPAFKITGGVLLFYVGFEMLMSNKSKIHSVDAKDEKSDIAVSPLAIPILAGPGTIVTAMNNVNNTNFLHIWIVISIFALMIFLTFLAFKFSDRIVYRLGPNMIKVIGKIMGLILAIMGTDMVIIGIKYAFKLTT